MMIEQKNMEFLNAKVHVISDINKIITQSFLN